MTNPKGIPTDSLLSKSYDYSSENQITRFRPEICLRIDLMTYGIVSSQYVQYSYKLDFCEKSAIND
jgi:hypothetical protein